MARRKTKGKRMKIRLSTIAILTLAAGTGFILFQTSQNVQRSEDRLRDMQQSLSREKESVRVLEAEWDYLNRPDRLEELARQYLKIQSPVLESLVSDSRQVPEPGVPALPRRKPVFVAQHAVMKTQSDLIAADPPMPPPASGPNNDSRQQFQDLLNTLTDQEPAAGGGQ
jgi:hypothetical protein